MIVFLKTVIESLSAIFSEKSTVKLFKCLAVFSVMISLTAFAVGCGGSTVSPDNDPVTSDENDPALEDSSPDETDGAK